MSGQTNFTFKGATTYYVTNAVNLYGTTTIEGGTVVKFAKAASPITINGPDFVCQTAPYRHAIFTAKDDDTVGETISGSTGNPLTNLWTGYGGGLSWVGYSLLGDNTGKPVHDIRFSFLTTALTLGRDDSETFEVSDAQFIHCYSSIYLTGGINLKNCLFQNGILTFTSSGDETDWSCEHLTVSQCSALNYAYHANLYLTNCLLVAVTNLDASGYYSLTTNHVAQESDPAAVFQTVGAGSHYLAINSPYRDAGTADISASLLKELKNKTTYPPVVLSNAASVATLDLTPQVPRDTDTPDLGYHYDPVDYALNAYYALSGETLTITGGTVITSFGDVGIWMRHESTIDCEGTAASPNRFVPYECVQENSIVWGGVKPWTHVTAYDGNRPDDSFTTGTFRFTEFDIRNDYETYNIYSAGDWVFDTLEMTDCVFRRARCNFGNNYSYDTLALKDNLFERAPASLFGDPAYTAYNNLFWRGGVYVENYGDNLRTFRDNAVDGGTMTIESGEGLTHDHNAYINASRNFSTGGSDIVLTNFTYAHGPLGDYYQASTNLIDLGSRSAVSAGLGSYTTRTNQVLDGGTTVDIGFHHAVEKIVTIAATVPLTFEPDGTNATTPGVFTVSRTDGGGAPLTDGNLTVNYQVGGSATPSEDYTAFNGAVTIRDGESSTNIFVTPLADSRIEFEESVIVTLTGNADYGAGSPSSATVLISDYFRTNIFTVVTNLPLAGGIDYHPPTQSLIVASPTYSDNTNSGSPIKKFDTNVFVRIDANGATTSWANATNILPILDDCNDCNEEMKLATVKANGGGFTNGEMFFGTVHYGIIGRMSADGSTYTNNWVTLPDQGFVGGLYVDQTGLFGSNLIAAAEDFGADGGIWSIDSSGNVTNIASDPDMYLLEGVVTLPNDTQKWGPWAGKIITGNEINGLIFSVDTNGTVAKFELGIAVEDFDIIRTNQDLYCTTDSTPILKLSRALLTNYVGDLLITQAGEKDSFSPFNPKLFIVHWDSTNSIFVTRSISGPGGTVFEHVTFAPIDIPSQ